MRTILAMALGLTFAVTASAEDVVLSGGIAEVVKLSKSGVAPSVVEEYIKSSQFPFKATVDDVLYMHKEGVPDEVISVLMKHGAEIRNAAMAFQAAEMKAPIQGQPQAAVPLPSPAPAYVPPTQPLVYTPPVAATYVDPYAASYPYYPSYPVYYGAPVYPLFYGSVGFGFRGGFHHGGFNHGGFGHGGFSHGGFSHVGAGGRSFGHR